MSHSPTATFDLFTRLPKEIRLLVWGFVAFHPRVIEMCESRYRMEVQQYFAKTPPPALLSVCKEARQEGLKHYEIFEFRNETLNAYFQDEGISDVNLEFLKESHPHSAQHVEPDITNCQVCARRAEQLAHVRYRMISGISFYARQGFEMARHFDDYLEMMENEMLADIGLSSDEKENIIERVELECRAAFMAATIPLRTYINPSQDIFCLGLSFYSCSKYHDSLYFFPMDVAIEQIQNVAVIVNDHPFGRRLAHWLFSCPNLKRIIDVIEPRFPSIEKRPTTGNIVAFASHFTASTCEGSSSAEVAEELRRCLEGKFEHAKLPWISPAGGAPRPRHLVDVEPSLQTNIANCLHPEILLGVPIREGERRGDEI